MIRRLWFQLTLAFGLVTLASVAVAALLANQRTAAEFRGFLAESQVQEAGLPELLAAHYQANQGWTGVEQVFAQMHGPGGMGAGRGMMRGALIVQLESGGQVVYATAAGAAGQIGDATALPIVVDGATIGTLYVWPAGAGALSLAAQRFLEQINRALVQAGVLGAVLGGVLGLLLARGLAAPLDRLAGAARRIAHGDLTQRVPVGGPAEVATAAEAFNEMAAALEASEEQRRRMVADIAHELRTPLTVIQGNLQAILEDVYPLEKREIATVYDETRLLGRLVDDLRELALAESGQLSLRTEAVAVEPLVRRSVALFAGPAQEKGVVLHADVAEGLPEVRADPDRADEVLRNLLVNALRHTPAGGRVVVSARRDRAMVIVSVVDSGQGIAPGDLAHVFERFWRADRARARERGGSGLGLAIARQLVLAQGGRIGVESEPGQGSRFWFMLPVSADGPA